MDKEQLIAALRGYSDTPALDVRFFYQDFPNPTPQQIRDFCRRRQMGEPVAKILGHCGFWNLDFIVSKDTLDPRPDSETLIESVLTLYSGSKSPKRILDIGTGSGCLLLTLLNQYPDAVGVGIDFSKPALDIAEQNALKLGIPAEFKQRDLMESNWTDGLGQFDVIVSNPPYIPSADIAGLNKSVRCFDPLTALDGGVDGLDAYRALANSIGALLSDKGFVFFEIGQGQAKSVCQIMKNAGFNCIQKCADLGNITRILVFEKD